LTPAVLYSNAIGNTNRCSKWGMGEGVSLSLSTEISMPSSICSIIHHSQGLFPFNSTRRDREKENARMAKTNPKMIV